MFSSGSLPSAIEVLSCQKLLCARTSTECALQCVAAPLLLRFCKRSTRFNKRDMLPDQIGIKGAPCGVS